MKLGIIVIFLTIALFAIAILSNSKPSSSISEQSKASKPGTCSASSCAPHDVNNPEYNIHEVIKNTLLIEGHLAERNKYCKNCLVKHYLISIAYLSEGIWMAGNKCKSYPKLEDSLKFYEDNFKQWYSDMDNDTNRLNALENLREWRRDMIQLYYFERRAVL